MISDEPVRGAVPPAWFWALPGIERIRAFSHGLLPLPPVSRLFGIRPAHVGPGSGIWTMPASAALLSEPGSLDISALVESALSGVATTTVDRGMRLEPVATSINYFRPTRPQVGSLLARARVVNASRLYVFSEVEIEDSQGRQIAHGGGHSELRPVEPTPPPPPAELRPVEEPSYATPDPCARPALGRMPPVEHEEGNDGLSIMRAFVDGTFVAPFQALLPVHFDDIAEGRVVLSLRTSEWLCGFSRSVSSGCIAALTVRAGVSALLTMLQRNESWVGLGLTHHFFRSAPADGSALRAEARGQRRARDLVTSSIAIYGADNTLVASAETIGALVDSSKRQRRVGPAARRVLATLLFVDIVGSSQHAERLGDARWRALLDEYRAVCRTELVRHDGIEVETIGDGLLARFDSPARALAYANAVRADVRRLGLQIRAGVHTGECELQSGKLSGLAVHIAARVQAAAVPGEVLTSRTVKDLAVGSRLRFVDRGEHTLKGIPGEWRLYALVE